MASTTVDILNEQSTQPGEIAAARRTRVAKTLGLHAVAQAWHKTGRAAKRFIHANKTPLMTTAGTLVMMAGLAAAAVGAVQALEVSAKNLSSELHATLTNSNTASTTSHNWQEGGLSGGGLALALAGTGTAARGLRNQRREQAALPAADWAPAQLPAATCAEVDAEYAPQLGQLNAMLEAPYQPNIWERMEARHAVAVAERAGNAIEGSRYNGFDTHMVPGALDLNTIAGLTAA